MGIDPSLALARPAGLQSQVQANKAQLSGLESEKTGLQSRADSAKDSSEVTDSSGKTNNTKPQGESKASLTDQLERLKDEIAGLRNEITSGQAQLEQEQSKTRAGDAQKSQGTQTAQNKKPTTAPVSSVGRSNSSVSPNGVNNTSQTAQSQAQKKPVA